jgi:hypothetical protein
MRHNNYLKHPLVLALLLLGCGDEQVFLSSVKVAERGQIKFMHVASDTVGVNFFFDDVKVSGGPTTTLSTGAINVGTIGYNGIFPGTNYSSIRPGSYGLKIIVPEFYTLTDTFLTKTLVSVNINVSQGAQTIALTGTSPNYEVVSFSDDLSVAPLDGNSYVRFANFIHNATNNLMLVGTPPSDAGAPPSTPVVLLENVPYKSVTQFVLLPKTGLYTNVQIKDHVTGTVIATLASGSSTFAGNRVYTVYARGQLSGTGTKAPNASRAVNR